MNNYEKIIYIAVAVIFFAGCSKAETDTVKNTTTLTADIAQFTSADGTKTSLDASKNVVWSSGDKIEIFDKSGNHETYTLSAGAGSTSGAFTGETLSSATHAIYPASAYTSYSSSKLNADVLNTQTYATSNIGNGAFPMVGTISSGNITFKNLFGILKLSLKGTGDVSSIVLTDFTHPLAGKITVDIDNENAVEFSSTDSENKYKVALNCASAVALNETNATDFYIVVPAGALADGFMAEVMNEKGHPMKVLYTTKANTISRNKIKAMPAVGGIAMTLPSGYIEYTYLQNTANQQEYINTGVVITANHAVSGKVIVDYPSGDFHMVMGSRQTKKYFYIGKYPERSEGWKFWLGYGSSQVIQTNDSATTNEEFKQRRIGEECYLLHNDLRYICNSGNSFLPTNKVYIFCCNRADSDTGEGEPYYYVREGKISHITMIEDVSSVTQVVRNFIPCNAAAAGNDANGKSYTEGAAGFYDTVNGAFYSNAHTSGSFTAFDVKVTTGSTENISNSSTYLW